MRDNENFTLIDILRHGQCQGGEIYRGSTDVSLTDLGWQQMRNAVASHSGWDAVVSSPLTRCKLFAQEHAAENQIPIAYCKLCEREASSTNMYDGISGREPTKKIK